MGQKTHPNGLRVGLYRKWVSSWYGSTKELAKTNPSQINQYYLSQGAISARGGVYLTNIEDFIENFFKRYFITKTSFTRRLLLVDFRFFKGFGGHTYGFLFYTKLIIRRKILYTMLIGFNNTAYIFSKNKRSHFKIKYNFIYFYNEMTTNIIKNKKISFIFIITKIIVFIKYSKIFIKNFQVKVINNFYQKKIVNFFMYNTITYVYFPVGMRLNSFIKIFCNKENFFIKTSSYYTKKNRFFFHRVLNCFEQTILFIDNIYIFSTIFFYNLYNINNNTNKFFKIKRFYRFTICSKRYTSCFTEANKVSTVNNVSKFKLIIWATKRFIKIQRILKKKIYNFIPFFIRHKYFIQKSKIGKFTSKFKFKPKTKRYRRVTNYTKDIIKGYKRVQPHSFHFKLSPVINNNKITTSTNTFSQLKMLLGFITNTQFSFYYLNAVSLARFAFDQEHFVFKNKKIQQYGITLKSNKKKGKRCSQRFLLNLEQEIIWRFRYVAIYIKDLIRIIFFCIYLKKATFLVSFFSFVLAKLPRNRKETQFLRFLIKLVKIFSTHRKEMLGLRIRFQGRVNRWRRTKHIIGVKGSVSYSSYNSRIVYGIAQAITRKGAQGIRLWLCYQPFFCKRLQHSMFMYTSIPKKNFIIKSKNKIIKSIYKIKKN